MSSKEKIRQNIIEFAKEKKRLRQKVTPNDINALFLGLANIVKKNAMEEVATDLKKECKDANENFRQTIVDLQRAETTLKKLSQENEKLKNKIESQQKQICFLLNRVENSFRIKSV